MRAARELIAMLLSLPVLLGATVLQAAQPPGFIRGEILRSEFGDLLTAGLGAAGLQGGPPPVSDPPTRAELRRLAIYNNYRALVDISDGGGFGLLYGPGVDADGNPVQDSQAIPGVEYLAFAGQPPGRANVSVMVQVPETFDPGNPCIVTGPSSGSRGIYGAIATSGEWGLKNGCAVAYTDKGTGTGAHDLTRDRVHLIDGRLADADAAGDDSTFTARVNDRLLARFNDATPDRFAFKHAHSRRNPEADWGRNVLQSIRFAFWALNEEFPGARIRPRNTIVIASSVSNGGGSSVQAAEQDRRGLIDGVAVSEPNVNPAPGGDFTIRQGTGPALSEHSRSLYDYTTLLNLYQACANVAPGLDAPFNLTPPAIGEARCASLFDKGLLTSTTLSDQAREAQQIINDFGILEEQNVVQPVQYFAYVPQAIAVTYANAYGRFSVLRRLCGYGFAASDAASGVPVPLSEAAAQVLFGTSNGIPPTGGVDLINESAVGGPRETRASTSPSTGRQDHNIDGNLCLRDLATGRDTVTGRRLRGPQWVAHARIKAGIRHIRASGDLHGKPAIIVTGRADAILPPNHTSRAYFGLNRVVEGGESRLSYIEVLNAQHLDTLNELPGFDSRFIPLHHYFVQALDIMLAHLRGERDLPPSQLVRTTPRGGTPGSVPDIDPSVHLPAISQTPDIDDEIRFVNGEVRIPE